MAKRNFATWLLFLLSCIVFLGKSYETSLKGIDANIHAAAAVKILEPGSWTPRLPIPYPNPPSWKEVDDPKLRGTFNDHPFTLFYGAGVLARWLGYSAWSVRILTAIFGAGCVMLVLAIGTTLRSYLLGFFAGVILLATRPFAMSAASFSLDPPMTFFILLSFYFALNRKFFWAGIAAGFGLWIKTPIVLLAFPVFAIRWMVPSLISGRDRKKEFFVGWGALVVAMVLGGLFWGLTGVLAGWDSVQDYWIRQVAGTVLGGRGNVQFRDPWIFFKILRKEYLPWIVFLGWAIFEITRRKDWKRFFEVATATGLIVVLISSLKFKFDYYFLPVYPFLALLSAAPLDYYLARFEQKVLHGFCYLVPTVAAAVVIAPISFSPEFFPGLRKFVPMIQREASCDSQIAIIRGGEPYASAHDYVFYLNFYTGKKAVPMDCHQADSVLVQRAIHWVIVSDDRSFGCGRGLQSYGFALAYRYGSQTLWTRLPEILGRPGEGVDLTGLSRELRAVDSNCAF